MKTKPALFAKASGSAGPVVVLLHGFGGNHSVWRRTADGLAAKCRVIAYDLPGHARSLRAEGSASGKAMAAVILADLAARQVPTFHVAGHSLGGAVAALMALAEPARLATLSLLAPGGFGPQINAALLQRFAEATAPTDIAVCLTAMMAPGRRADAAAVATMARQRSRGDQSARLGDMMRFIARDGRQGTIPLPRLAGLHIPTTVGWGRLDPVLPVTQALRSPATFEVRLFERAGHMLIEECPEGVAKLISDAVSRA